jgi:hypothetical protein
MRAIAGTVVVRLPGSRCLRGASRLAGMIPSFAKASRVAGLSAVALLSACHSRPAPLSTAGPVATTPATVRSLLEPLADDSMQGRLTGTAGAERAARFIAAEMQRSGLTPLGDSGYIQRVPLVLRAGRDGRKRLALAASFAARDSQPAADRRLGMNVLGVLRGSDPTLGAEVVLMDAHYDHLGVGHPESAMGGPQGADSIYNGADDDASGVVTTLLVARALAAGPRLKRTVIFAAMTGEEVGLLGTRWYIAHPAIALEQTVANLEVEMIGRPDSLSGGMGKAWLTGYERSTMGDALKANGVPIVADPHPSEHFFERSDNIAFARRGIVAHTLSSFNLHTDYHTPADDAAHVNYPHMAAVVDAAVQAVRILADGPRPAWHAGGQPQASTP